MYCGANAVGPVELVLPVPPDPDVPPEAPEVPLDDPELYEDELLTLPDIP